MSDPQMTHAKIKLPRPEVHGDHPYLHAKNHQKLLEYIQQRLLAGKNARDANLDRLTSIDKAVAGWQKLSAEDKRRARKKEETGTPQAITMNLPLAYVHLDDMMTFFAQTFSPNRGMFYHTGKPDETGEATQIITIMNNNAIYAGYYREVLLGLYSILKYNTGGYEVYWSKELGPKLRLNQQGQDELTYDVRWQGNRLEAIDVYNFLPDPSVHPTKLHCDGEFAAKAMLKSYYWLQNKASQGQLFNCETALRNHNGVEQCVYYRSPPREAMMEVDESGGTNWKAMLSEVPFAEFAGFELVECTIRLNPTEFGLVTGNRQAQQARDRYETWKITILNDKYIVWAEQLNNIHGYLPFFLGLLNDDLMGTSQKSTAEILNPLQDFASFLMNTHIMATRKNIWGIIAYDPTAIDLTKIPVGEVSARIPVKPAAQGKDIRQFIWTHNDNLETRQTLQDLSGVMDLINQFFPTQALPSQIANIDRAVESQVAAVQHGANRRQQKAAKLLDESIFSKVRFAMYYNIIQYQPDSSEVTDFFTGKAIQIDLSALRNTDLPFIIGQGLKAIDRQMVATMMQQIIFALIQAPAAAQGIDMLALIDHWTSMIDVDIDMKQFRIQQPQEGEGQPQVDEQGNPINPATNPQRLTQPIYGGSD